LTLAGRRAERAGALAFFEMRPPRAVSVLISLLPMGQL
jgi:hypothetical protein